MDPRTLANLDAGILLRNDFEHLRAVQVLCRFAFLRLAEAELDHLGHILLLHVPLVQLLDAGHLVVVEPVGSLQLAQFVQHLGIQLVVVDVARIVDEPSLRDGQTDVATRTRGVRQRMGVVGRRHKRGEAWAVLL